MFNFLLLVAATLYGQARGCREPHLWPVHSGQQHLDRLNFLIFRGQQLKWGKVDTIKTNKAKKIFFVKSKSH